MIIPDECTFGQAAEGHLREVKVLAATTRSSEYVQNLELRMNRHILPYFGDKPLSAVNRGLVQAYRVKRAEETIERTKTDDKPGHPPARNTMLNEIVHIRQVLKYAEGHGWIKFVPDLSTPYMTQGKRGRRAWFSPEEYEQLYKATRRRITEGKRPGWKTHYEDMHDFVLFMANTGLRPDEVWNLEIRDVKIEDDYATRKTILVIDVRGKVGTGYCKSMPNAVFPFQNLRNRREAELKELGKTEEEISKLLPKIKVFRGFNRAMFNNVLAEEGLKLIETVSAARLTACGTLIYLCDSWRGPTFIKSPITAGPACR
jgi:hypothetical protein